jgi:lipopolysaccharide assembly protein A
MKLLAWLLKLAFFLLVLWFALKNTTPVPVRFTAQTSWENVPLIVVMLVCVGLGALLGALALALPMYRLRRESAQHETRRRCAQPRSNPPVSAWLPPRGSRARSPNWVPPSVS